MNRYAEFLATKAIKPNPVGIRDGVKLPKALKPFQVDVVRWALAQGRAAVFAGTGLGKTLMQLSWADAMHQHTGKPTLILTPLAVSHQTVREAAKFKIKSCAYAAEQSEAKTNIVITNIDRVGKFDMDQFGAIVIDESSVLKASDSKTRALLTDMCSGMPYKLCCTATPAPNDFVELGSHSEFLGVLNAKEMLATWFVHDGSGKATNAQNHGSKPTAEWRLKGHAESDFWRWVSTWAVMIRHPRDIGYDDAGYDLPPLVKHQITVPTSYESAVASGMLFAMEARTLQEQRAAARASIDSRVKAVADLVNAQTDRQWIVWCHLNDEADALVKAIPDAVEVRGTDDPDMKTERLLGFADAKFRVMVTKSKIAGMGMNYQSCHSMAFVGLNNSFEQVYQAIRRCWRFGQTKPVDVYMVAAETEGAVVSNLEAKEKAAEYMGNQLAAHMSDLTKRALQQSETRTMSVHGAKMELPTWLM
jgi:hypothetical protein